MRNPLNAILPAHVRRYVYAILALAAIVLAAYKASDGDWLAFAVNLLSGLGFGMAGSNINSDE
jgi:hypothetical protein